MLAVAARGSALSNKTHCFVNTSAYVLQHASLRAARPGRRRRCRPGTAAHAAAQAQKRRGGADASPAVKPFSAELKPQRASARDVFATAARHAWPQGDWPQHALVVAAVAFLVGQKLLNVRVPFLLSRVVDALQASEADKASQAAAAYVLGRVLTSACGELRSLCFARVSFGSGRRFARSTFASLHALPSSWHAKRAVRY